MIDVYNLAKRDYFQIYYSSGSWYKPRGVSNVLITAIGAGGGGGGGATAASGAAKGGGGGGASGGISRLYLPAILVPDLLTITVGAGGSGGAPGATASAGGNGGQTIIDVANTTNASQTYFLIANGGGGGGGATTAARGTAGTAAAISTSAAALFCNLGHTNFVVGMAGSLGGLTALNSPGSGIAYSGVAPYAPLTGGGGGGGRSGAGGSIAPSGGLGSDYFPTIAGGTSTTLLNGNGGFYKIKPFYSLGGGGGFGVDTLPGGNGGPGGPGSGGGGGGAGTTGGTGGKGGDGLVIITCW